MDTKRVGIEGYSRHGEAVAVMTYGARMAIAYVSSSGEDRLKIHRRDRRELVENVVAPNEYR